MIVTRQRKKRFRWKRALVPALALAAIVSALSYAPSRTWIAARSGLVPLMQQREIRSDRAQIISLRSQLAAARAQTASDDTQISQLQTQLNDAQQQAAVVKGAAKPVTAATAPPGAADLATQGTPDMRRTAQVWSAMDSDAAAKVVTRLPIDYVARVFALMTPDSVGAVLENVPAAYAARLTQEHPELSR